MKRRYSSASAVCAALALVSFPPPVLAAFQFNLPAPKTALAQEMYDLHSLILLVCGVIFVGVFGAMFYALFKHRKSRGHAAQNFHENTAVEVAWTLIPFLILIGMAWPATRLVIAQKDTAHADLTIKVTGYQWKWGYEYLGEDVKFLSVLTTPQEQIENRAAKGAHYLLEVDQPLVVPAGKKVRLLTTSADVIHSWWVPELGVKQDAIPGFIRDAWFKANQPGVYRGQCAELCGKGHGFMPIVVEVKSEADYALWLAQRKQQSAAAGDVSRPLAREALLAQGRTVYEGNCAACHGADGKGIPGAFPAIDGSKVATGPKEAHIQRVLNGKEGTPMPAFAKQLSATEIAAVITFQRNAWSNKTGDVIQPAEIAAQLK